MNCKSAILDRKWAQMRLTSARTYLTVKHFIVVAIIAVSWVSQCQIALASCGDYLHHRPQIFVVPGVIKLAGLTAEADHSFPISKCRNGECRSQDLPAFPPNSQFRRDVERPEMYLAKFDLLMLCPYGSRLITDEAIPSQPILDVAEPPPRCAF